MIIPGLAIPVFSKIFVVQILIKQAESWVIPLLTGMMLTATLRFFLSWIQQNSLTGFEMSLSLKSSAKFLWRVLHLPMSFHVQRPSGDISMRVTLNDKIAGLMAGQVGNTLLNLFMIVFYADRIYVMDQGTIAETGTYEELMAKNGIFPDSSICISCSNCLIIKSNLFLKLPFRH